MKDSIKIRQNKHYRLFAVFESWLSLKEEGKSLAEFLKRRNINTVAIYGCGKIGEHLAYEFGRGGIQIAYFIDQAANPEYQYREWRVISPEQPFASVDMVIVTVLSGEHDCIDILRKKTDAAIYLIQDLIDDCLQEIRFQ